MNDQDMKKAVKHAVDHRLSRLDENPFLAQRIIASEKGAQPVVKKKISVSLILVIILMTLTLSVAYALVQSNIANKMYGENEVPQEVMEQIQLPSKSIESSLGTLSIDELLYDGSSLHTSFTITNPTNETLLYTVDGIWLDDAALTRSTLITEGAGTSGLLLGGTVDGSAMPQSYSVYNVGNELYQLNADGKYLGMTPLPKGNATFKISVAVWRPINQPKLINYKDYEGVNVTDTLNHLVTDHEGYAQLELFRPRKYNLNPKANQFSSDVYSEAYKALGWAEFVDRIDIELDVNLDQSNLSYATPKDLEYQIDDLKLTITDFTLTHTGGKMIGWIHGDSASIKAFMGKGLILADKEGDRALNINCIWDDEPDANGKLNFSLEFYPVADKLPERVYLASYTAHDPRWDKHSPSYNPSVEKPENVVGAFQLDFSRSIQIDLK